MSFCAPTGPCRFAKWTRRWYWPARIGQVLSKQQKYPILLLANSSVARVQRLVPRRYRLLCPLDYSLMRLLWQSTTAYSALDRQELRQLLASTIRALHQLYPASVSPVQRYALLQNLNLLAQQALALAAPGEVALTTWQFLHASLRATIEAALVDEAAWCRNSNSA